MQPPKGTPATKPLKGTETFRGNQEGKSVIFEVADLAGAAGRSAYELAVAGGFKGTQAEWMVSLKGRDAQQPQRTILTTDPSGIATWTFPTPYAAGVIPTPTFAVQDASVDAITVKFPAISNTGLTLKAQKLLLNLLGLQNAAGVRIHVSVSAAT